MIAVALIETTVALEKTTRRDVELQGVQDYVGGICCHIGLPAL